MAFSLQICLEGQHPRVASSLLTLRLVFCGYYLMRMPVEASVSNVLVRLLSCAPWPPTPFYILVSASLHSSVKGVVHSVVRDLQFLCNFSHGIALISQNRNRLMTFRRKFFVSGHFEPVIEPTNAYVPDTQPV